MRALTICQPYAELIARGVKRVENRRWATNVRGDILIHAGKSLEYLDLDESESFDEQYGINLKDMTFGAIVAMATLTDCIALGRIESERRKTHTVRTGADFPSRLEFLLNHEHVEGPWCFVLANIRRIEPIPYRGAQGFFNVPDEIIAPTLLG